jgi:hypothetical protein
VRAVTTDFDIFVHNGARLIQIAVDREPAAEHVGDRSPVLAPRR